MTRIIVRDRIHGIIAYETGLDWQAVRHGEDRYSYWWRQAMEAFGFSAGEREAIVETTDYYCAHRDEGFDLEEELPRFWRIDADPNSILVHLGMEFEDCLRVLLASACHAWFNWHDERALRAGLGYPDGPIHGPDGFAPGFANHVTWRMLEYRYEGDGFVRRIPGEGTILIYDGREED
jgi:hypothetical protein